MSVVVKFPEHIVKLDNVGKKKNTFNLFEKLSNRLGVDIDKVVFDKDENEKIKLERTLKKESMKERSKHIE
ncbi:hypothetical protein [Brevundimonas sp. NPDC058933]|uniref:hypothetical protein n=1 Tax=Brevundimonas sp. NPDC058933 TaxID=3346673 RepID=UPI003BEF4C07